MINSLQGKYVRLIPIEKDREVEFYMRWQSNSEYQRFLDSSPAMIFSKSQRSKWLEENAQSDDQIMFSIQEIQSGKILGFIELDGFKNNFVNTYVGIAIGDPEDWSKGFGTDAMQIILKYAFTTLNLHRVSLTVFEYNPRGIRSYEKVGFKHEGARRQFLQRDGKRWDMLQMGILKEEWLNHQEK